jgi:hypothetical protein
MQRRFRKQRIDERELNIILAAASLIWIKWAAVRCPSDFDELMRLGRRAPGAGISALADRRRRLGPLLREFRRTTDPLFRRAGIDSTRDYLAFAGE